MKARASRLAAHMRLLTDAAEQHQAEIDKDITRRSVAFLAQRWDVSCSTVRAIPASELPYINVGHGLKNELRRYLDADIAAYEARRTQRAG